MATNVDLSKINELSLEQLQELTSQLTQQAKILTEQKEFSNFLKTAKDAVKSLTANVGNCKNKAEVKDLFLETYKGLGFSTKTSGSTKTTFAGVCKECFTNGLSFAESVIKLQSIFTEKPEQSIKADLRWHAAQNGYYLNEAEIWVKK